MTKKGLLILLILPCLTGCNSQFEKLTQEEPMQISEQMDVTLRDHNPQSSDFNNYFQDLALLADTEVPHKFSPGETFDQKKINENFMAIIAGFDKKRKVLHAR